VCIWTLRVCRLDSANLCLNEDNPGHTLALWLGRVWPFALLAGICFSSAFAYEAVGFGMVRGLGDLVGYDLVCRCSMLEHKLDVGWDPERYSPMRGRGLKKGGAAPSHTASAPD
jgi:hypothetical protein